MADPPAYLPWIIAALFLVVLAWSLWPSRDEGTESKSDAHHNGDKTGFIVSIGGKNNRFEDNSGPADRPIVTLINEEGSVAKGNRPHGPQPK